MPPLDVHSPVASGRRRVPPLAFVVACDLNSMASTHLRHPAPRCLGLAREVADRAETSRARRPCPVGSVAATRAPRAEGRALSASSFDGDGRSVESLTLRALKTYENHGPTLQFFYAFSIILIHEEKFQLQFPSEIRGKKNSANAIIRQHLTRAFERGATQHHRVITGLSRVVYYVFQRMEDIAVRPYKLAGTLVRYQTGTKCSRPKREMENRK